jgi:Nitrile hydratase beta subunit
MKEALVFRGHHDMGGQPADRVEPVEHDYEAWERRVDALMVLLSGLKGGRRFITVDELRKNIEALPPDSYDRLAYYEKWITSLTQCAIQRGLISTAELAHKMKEVKARA